MCRFVAFKKSPFLIFYTYGDDDSCDVAVQYCTYFTLELYNVFLTDSITV